MMRTMETGSGQTTGDGAGDIPLARAGGSPLKSYIDEHPWAAFSILSAFYVLVVLTQSSFKLLWLDELITLHIAQQGSVQAIWNALQRGADPNPPVTHILVFLSKSLLGDHEWAYRLPDFIGYWLGLLALFSYLRKHVSATWAIGGTLLSMAMAAFDYSYESRSYAIFYGLAMVAFYCWTVAVEEQRRGSARSAALAGMVLALALGISTNYFAVLAFMPIAAGEAVRTWMRWRERRFLEPARSSLFRVIDFRIWIGLLLGGLPLLVYRGMIAHSIAQFAPYAWNKVSVDQVFDSYTEMVEVVLYPILALFVLWIAVRAAAGTFKSVCARCEGDLRRRWIGRLVVDSRRITIPTHEAAGILFLMMYPILGYVIASIRGGMLSPRFVIPVCFGFAIAATLVARALFAGFRRAAVVFVVFMMAWFVAREAYVGYWYQEQKQCFYKVLDHLPEAEAVAPPGAPIVIPDPLLALTFQHYAPRRLAARAAMPVDFPAIRHFRHDDSPEENLWAGRSFLYSLPIVPLATFQHATGGYLIIAGDGNWMLEDLAAHRYVYQHLPIDTRADAIGGFTPLARGTPGFYLACGDQIDCDVVLRPVVPVPFKVADNLPNADYKDPMDRTP